MRKRVIIWIVICLLVLPVIVILSSLLETGSGDGVAKANEYYSAGALSTNPCTKEDGSKFRIAYVDIDPYPASGEMLYYFIQELHDTGWITLPEMLPFDSSNTDAKEMINYLAEQDLGDYIEFSKDANYYVAVDDYEECKRSLQKHVADKDIDLIFCMGTSPGTMVIDELGITDVPVMVYFSVDPVGAGFSETEEYSGHDNIWCHTSSEVYLNQLQFYHNSYDFDNIGMVYYSESVGAMNQYRSASEQIGCKISERQIETLTSSDADEVEQYYAMLEDTFDDLINNAHIDAFMLGTDIIKDTARIKPMLSKFYDKGIPVFVQNGEYYAEYGALMVATASDAQSQAPFAVNAMSLIFNGNKPGDIYQKFVISPYVCINLDAADELGYTVSEELLLSAEKLFSEKSKSED